MVNIQITVCCKLTQCSLVGNISEEMAASIFRAEERFIWQIALYHQCMFTKLHQSPEGYGEVF